MNTSYRHLKFECFDEVGYLSINRPDKLNSLNKEVLKELRSFLREFLQDKEYRMKGLIFFGEGEKAFIAGADISEMAAMNEKEAYEFAHLGQHVSFLFERLNLPVVAAVHGFALGGGLEMAMSCDFILCSKCAVFGQPEVKLGLIPGFGGTQRLSKLVGRQRAREIIYTGRNISSDEAYRIGLVLEIHENKTALLEAAKNKVFEMKKNSPFAISGAKKVMNLGNDLTLSEGLNLELDQFSVIFSSQDMKEGTKSFLEKRRPNFLGK